VETLEKVLYATFGNILIVEIILDFPDLDPRNLIPIYLAWLISCSFLSFLFYGYDKIKAIRGGFRTSENVLHLLALSGGFVGCALGMALFRHKLRKKKIKIIIFLAFSIHGFIFLYLLMLWM
jgi:uncharacterized membrane protein YsdA (DUF1294 family)